MHDEAERDQRDDPDHLAGVRPHPSVRAGRPARRLRRCCAAQLERWLCEATGYAGVSLQPNAGSQGEYAGLLAIQAWHAARGEASRNVCLIPESAHGTNPASAQMVGMQVVVTQVRRRRQRRPRRPARPSASSTRERLAAVMITYPSTYGVFESRASRSCARSSTAHGGRVYVDGANMNALVGVAAPGEFGGDVSHLNLHKTFCIPHGGGGPGVGPVCVVADLVPYLPGHAAAAGIGAERAVGAVSAAPLGNAAVLPISWMYMRMMGADGLQRGHRDRDPVGQLHRRAPRRPLRLHYSGNVAGIKGGGVAHECILDLRPLKDATGGAQGVSAEDVAKRLIDYGFHAPTLSFPVPGTLMVEPTESESLAELDRFCDAMIAIRDEIAQVEQGVWPRDDNPLKHAPHTAEALLAGRLAASVLARAGRLSAGRAARQQVLVAGRPGRQRLGRPQPLLLLPAALGLRGLTRRSKTGTAYACSAASQPRSWAHDDRNAREERLFPRQAGRHGVAQRRPARLLPLQGPRRRGRRPAAG